MAAKIRFIKKSEVKKLINFNSKEYCPKHILTNKKYLDWQFGSYPKNKNYYSILGIFNTKEDLLGILGLTFLDYNFFGEKKICNSFANLMVKKQYQNLGYGYLLLEKSMSFNDIAVDHGINQKALPLFENTGWQEKDIDKYVYIINSTNTKKITAKKQAEITEAKANYTINSREKKYNFYQIKRANKDIDKLWQNLKNKYHITVERSSSYLNWRYLNHPFLNYKFFITTRGKEIISFIVLRIETPLNFKVARIIDFISINDVEEYTLFKATEYCKIKNIDFIDYFFSGNYHLKSLKDVGFVNSYKGDYSYIPMLLNPIDRKRRTKINLAFKALDNSIDRKLINNFNNWYTTKGGGDQDRPN